MRTRRDQVQAYRFVTRRIVSAMLSGEPEAVERPMRRLGLSLLASAMVATLVVAGFGVWGLVTNQGRELTGDLLVIERDTQARYLYINDRLHPVANMTSVQLILGRPDPERRSGVSRSTLRDIPRGHPLGIVGAPEAVPVADDLVGPPWSVCSVPPTPDNPAPQTTVVVGTEMPGGSPVGDQGLYVAVGETGYLVWRDRLLRLSHPVAPVTLGLAAVTPTQIGTPLLNALTAGPDLDVVRPPGAGELTGFEVSGQPTHVGEFFVAAGQHYLMTRDGLRPVGNLAVALGTSESGAPVRDISGFEVSNLLVSNEPLEGAAYPPEAPQLHPANGQAATICAIYRGGGQAVAVEVFPALDERFRTSVPLRQTDRDVVAAADHLWLPPGRGALVRAASLTGEVTENATVYLVTDTGRKHPISTAAARSALGYGQVDPEPVPVDLLELIPTGPTLDIDAARSGLEAAPA
jgi:type VII secretion protein EccB